MDRDQIGQLTAIVSTRRRRPVAHILTILGFTADGPTYTFECRAPARDLGKQCAAWIWCECDPHEVRDADGRGDLIDARCTGGPTGRHELHDDVLMRQAYGCAFAYADAEDTDDAVKELVGEHRLRRGVFLLDVRGGNGADVELTLLGEIHNRVGPLPAEPEACSVRATRDMRYPGYGPEVELRELIEEALSQEAAEAVVWDDDHAEIVVDANGAAKAVLAWIEDRYDIPPDQRTLPGLAHVVASQVKPPPYATSRIATVHPIGDRL